MKLLWICSLGVAAGQALNAPFQTYPDCSKSPLASNKVCDRKLSPVQRAKALVAAMTNEEKLKNLIRYVLPL